LFKFPPHTISALALLGEIRPSKACIEMNEKNLNKSIQISGPQQPLDYKVWLSWSVSTRWRSRMFMNSRSDWWSLDWSEAEHRQYCCQWIRKASRLCSQNAPIFQAFFAV